METKKLVGKYRQKYHASLYLQYMCDLADQWPGWHGGYALWHIEQRTWPNVTIFCDAHEELRLATMLEI